MSTVGRRLAALVAVLSLVVVGCGGVGGGDDQQPQSGQSGGEISGTLSTFGFSLPDEIATARVDTFKKAYPKVQVKITEGGFDEQQFLSAVASGSPPDLVYVDARSSAPTPPAAPSSPWTTASPRPRSTWASSGRRPPSRSPSTARSTGSRSSTRSG
jgi:ABC-type glycerol-3-phosphate transport system substrate-binding protein